MDAWKKFSVEVSRRPAIYYLAYGSNLSLERMAKRCPDAIAAGISKIPGYRLLFKKSGSGFTPPSNRMPTALCRPWSIRSANLMKPC